MGARQQDMAAEEPGVQHDAAEDERDGDNDNRGAAIRVRAVPVLPLLQELER